MKTNRLHAILLISITIASGLLARHFSNHLPEFTNLILGDALYALMIYWIVRFFLQGATDLKVFVISILVCYTIEFSQLLQFEWLVAIRGHQLGALILGKGFLFSDLFAYAVGALSGYGLDFMASRHFRSKKQP